MGRNINLSRQKKQLIYCESILFRGAEISSIEDDGHIRGYLTSRIALPTKIKKYKIITFNFWQVRN